MRYKIIIEYDGTLYAGWQKQKDQPSIQEEIEKSLFAFRREHILVEGAGRTDRGVHAIGQVAHIDLSDHFIDRYKFLCAINHFLTGIAITDIVPVEQRFHARFSAKERQYVYKIHNHIVPSPLLKNRAWHVRQILDTKKMQEAANDLVGTHDFSAFRSVDCQAKNAKRTFLEAKITKENNQILCLFRAPSFLHNQIRIIMGTLKKVGEGRFDVDIIKKGLLSKDRTQMGVTAPACGLYLKDVLY